MAFLLLLRTVWTLAVSYPLVANNVCFQCALKNLSCCINSIGIHSVTMIEACIYACMKTSWNCTMIEAGWMPVQNKAATVCQARQIKFTAKCTWGFAHPQMLLIPMRKVKTGWYVCSFLKGIYIYQKTYTAASPQRNAGLLVFVCLFKFSEITMLIALD